MKTKLILLTLLLLTLGLAAQTENPYAAFGYEGKVLTTPQERIKEMLLIPNADTSSVVATLGIETSNGKYYLFDKAKNIITEGDISQEQLARFVSGDPLPKAYESSYSGIANNPINYIDPDGRDTVEVYSKEGGNGDKSWKGGEMKNYTKASGNDVFFTLDNKGNRENSITLPENSIKGVEAGIKITYKTMDNVEKVGTIDRYEINGNENASQLFGFLAENTNVEFDHLKASDKDNNDENFVSTAHEEASSAGFVFALDKAKEGLKLKEFNHNHPNNNPNPSGDANDPNTRGDIGVAITAKNYGYDMSFNVYTARDCTYHPFNAKGRTYDEIPLNGLQINY